MIKTLIKEFSNGKILLKYDLVTPVIQHKRIRLISILFFVFIVVCSIVLVFLLKYRFLAVVAGSIYLLILFIIEYYFRSKIYLYDKNGSIEFHPDFIVIEIGDDFSKQVLYSEIAYIRIKTGLPKTFLGRNPRTELKSVRTSWKLIDKTLLLLEIKMDLEVPDENKKTFSRIEPKVIRLIENIPNYKSRIDTEWI